MQMAYYKLTPQQKLAAAAIGPEVGSFIQVAGLMDQPVYAKVLESSSGEPLSGPRFYLVIRKHPVEIQNMLPGVNLYYIDRQIDAGDETIKVVDGKISDLCIRGEPEFRVPVKNRLITPADAAQEGVQVTAHKNSAVAADTNNKLTIAGFDVSVGGAPSVYKISHDAGPGHIDLVFETFDRPGITNEALLAIILTRLEGFQRGPYACNENAQAITRLREAMMVLHARTARVRDKTSTTPEAVKMSGTKTRVAIEGDQLRVGASMFDLVAVTSQWKTWSAIEAACRALDVPLTEYELSVLEACATSGAAKNGLAELKQALARTRKAS